jgi:tRNA G18 (ribose-2'-O)-methylase SpoU
MALQQIATIDDPRLEPYRNMKDRELARAGGRFIAEGEQLVRRLLASAISVDSLLIAERKAELTTPLVPAEVPIFVAADEVIQRIIGFKFHSGVMACGIRPGPVALEEIVLPMDRPILLAICQQITNTENMGSLIRVAAGLGVDALVLGERCCDPFFRQSVRVSMGAVFKLPIVTSTNLNDDLDRMRRLWGICPVASVLDETAESLISVRRLPRMGVVFGSEAQGLDQMTINQCDRKVTIPMRLGTDSLNVSIAAAIFLFHLTAQKM